MSATPFRIDLIEAIAAGNQTPAPLKSLGELCVDCARKYQHAPHLAAQMFRRRLDDLQDSFNRFEIAASRGQDVSRFPVQDAMDFARAVGMLGAFAEIAEGKAVTV